MRCSKCGSDNPSGKKFCGDCGARLGNSCAKCEAENPESKKFCGDCGTYLGNGDRATLSTQPRWAATPALRMAAEAEGVEVPDGEPKTVTALFADIKGSMELMEDLNPEEARAIVDPALRRMIDAVHRYDGYVVQSTGDGIFALFGALPIRPRPGPSSSCVKPFPQTTGTGLSFMTATRSSPPDWMLR